MLQQHYPHDLLEPGDVLLSFGHGELSSAIKALDGGSYSHAAIFTGENVIESTEPVVVEHSLADSLALHPRVYVDAYRHQHGREHGERVARAARDFVGRRYAYGDLFLGGMLIATSARLPPANDQIRFLLAAAKTMEFLHLDRCGEDGLVTCVELVVRAHVAAGAALELCIEGERRFESEALVAGVREVVGRARAKSGDNGWEEAQWHDTRALFRNKVQDLLDIEQPRGTPKGLFRSPPLLSVPHRVQAGVDWPPNLVTPRDLAGSPSLRALGRVSGPLGAESDRPGAAAQAVEKPANFSPLR